MLEFADHYKSLCSIASLFSTRAEVCAIVFDEQAYDWQMQCKKFIESGATIKAVRSATDFFRRAWMAYPQVDHVFIVTGYEFSLGPRFFAFIFSLVMFRPKVTLVVRNVSQYGVGTKQYVGTRFASTIRGFFVRRVPRIVFESRTQMLSFIVSANYAGQQLTWMLDRFPTNVVSTTRATRSQGATLRLGVLGTVDPTRRNYALLKSAILKAPLSVRRQLVLVFLGGAIRGDAAEIVSGFSDLVRCEMVQGMLSEESLFSQGITCHALVSPLHEGKNYGLTHGTGSFGDAVWLRKRLFVPRRVDPLREFEDFCWYYDTLISLGDLITKASDSPASLAPDPSVWTTYSAQPTCRRLLVELGFTHYLS